MELFLFFGAMAVLMVIILVREAIEAKRNEKRFVTSLYEKYGELPKKEYSPERFLRMGSYFKKHMPKEYIDDITWNDLNMDEVFKRMNYTFSASGEEYLYYTLRNTGSSKEELAHLEEVVGFLKQNEETRVKLQFIMSRLGYTGKYSLYDYIDNLDYLGKRSNAKHILMNLLFVPLLILLPFQMSLAIAGLVLVMIYNIVSYFREKGEIEPYIISFAYVVRLLTACDRLLKVEVPVCEEEWNSIRTHKQKLAALRRGSFWVFSIGKLSSGNPIDIIMDYVKMVFHVDIMKFNKMLLHIRTHVEDVDALIMQVGYLETAIAIGALRNSLEEYCVPQLTEGKELKIENAYHILLEEPVKNCISTDRGVLLTGSNASGKSTFLKAVALNTILAQTIHTCTAASYCASLFTVYSSMSLRDSIESGESYYIVEIKALKRILDAADKSEKRVMCFVDEVLRGTNTVERIAASTQILKSLAAENILCFAATHDIELTELLEQLYENYHFEEDIRDGDVFFNYKLLPGKAVTRNAIKLLEIMGYEDSIIQSASNQAERFVKTGKWQLV